MIGFLIPKVEGNLALCSIRATRQEVNAALRILQSLGTEAGEANALLEGAQGIFQG